MPTKTHPTADAVAPVATDRFADLAERLRQVTADDADEQRAVKWLERLLADDAADEKAAKK